MATIKTLLLGIFLFSLTSCTGAVILPGIALFGLQQETESPGHSKEYMVPPNYADFNAVDHSFRMAQLRAQWNTKFESIDIDARKEELEKDQ